MSRLREKRAEVLINLESVINVLGKAPEQTPYAGEESRRLRSASRERLAEWMERAYILIPERDANGNLIGEKRIPLIEAGSTRYKSYAEFIGFVSALQELALEEGRVWCMVTTNAPANMHPSSRFYDGTTPREANLWLSKKNKAALYLLRKWLVQCAGVRMKEPHQSSVPHAHTAIAHTARAIAEIRYNQLLDTLKEMGMTEADLLGEWEAYAGEVDGVIQHERKPSMTREAYIDGMMRDLIEAAFERQFIDLKRDDETGRLIYGVGVDCKFDDDHASGASFISYVMPYILKSFSIDHDHLPKQENYASDAEHKAAMKEAVRQQVEHGGEIGISAWAAAHGIRTREIFGMPSRSPWRALGKQHDVLADQDMEDMRQLILKNKHAEYVRKQGGLNPGRDAAKLRMARQTLASNYPLRPDMLRRRVWGVTRYALDVDGTIQPAAFHRTHLSGCKIVAQRDETREALRGLKQVKEKSAAKAAWLEAKKARKAKRPGGVPQEPALNGAGALAPNYPRRVPCTLNSAGTAPPPEQKLLH
jgi:hypothetical protein